MLTIERHNQFKKDIKKLKRSGQRDLLKLKEILLILVNEKTLPEKYRNHKLKGNWNDFMECHIEPDWLMIYKINENSKKLILARTGSHSELFL